MNIQLTPELEQLVQSQVRAGRFSSPSEVVYEALRLLEDKHTNRIGQLQDLRDRMDKGLTEAERGESVDGEAFMQSLIDDLDAREAKHTAG